MPSFGKDFRKSTETDDNIYKGDLYMTKICGQQFDEERALYHSLDTEISDCIFAGPADGESVLKESRNIRVSHCDFSLRYPLWHAEGFTLENSHLDELTRAAIWYSHHGKIKDCKLFGIKAVRECSDIVIENTEILSEEFGWKSSEITLKDAAVTSEYLFLDSKNIKLDRVQMSGKYSFQYIDGLEIENSVLDTKDAFWHSKNVTVRNCVVKGEYLGWFSDVLTLINCKIIGTQPLCYCKNLTLINCETEKCDLSFEYSDVRAEICGHIDSVKNPKSGKITADSVGEIITENPVMECKGEVIIRRKEEIV